ncbi:DUF3168 domain-containing protein [Chelativorans sp. Marseille-P2723]|uniref:DUF3168 domain-containing protein n=1 Tax=Chelativorans sp. Marseille-P2723 TaxID=2709133 RepID=UPI0015706ECD|nr:DUF3168 domain-containing protein [Chelativorans sp. Marseille-P2723]
MTAAAIELQRAVAKRLGEEADLVAEMRGAKFHDVAPANLTFPYITFGRASTYDWSTATEEGSEHLFALHIWSTYKGRKEALRLMDMVRAALHEGELKFDDHHLVSLRLISTEMRFDEAISAYEGVMRFRALVE